MAHALIKGDAIERPIETGGLDDGDGFFGREFRIGRGVEIAADEDGDGATSAVEFDHGVEVREELAGGFFPNGDIWGDAIAIAFEMQSVGEEGASVGEVEGGKDVAAGRAVGGGFLPILGPAGIHGEAGGDGLILRALGEIAHDVHLETGDDADEFFHGGPVVNLLTDEDVGFERNEGILRRFHLFILRGLGSVWFATGEPLHVPVDHADVIGAGESEGKKE